MAVAVLFVCLAWDQPQGSQGQVTMARAASPSPIQRSAAGAGQDPGAVGHREDLGTGRGSRRGAAFIPLTAAPRACWQKRF